VKRVGMVLALLAGCLAILVGLLVQRALESASFEKTVRHQVVSDRSFDEMERALSSFLEREESRPFFDYRFYLDSGGGNLRRSPLSRPPEQPFVVGYFQIDPDGSLHTPRRPRDPDLAQRRGDWDFPREVSQLEASLEKAWRQARRTPPKPAISTAARKRMDSRAEAVPPAPKPLSAGKDEQPAQRTEEAQSTYDVLRKMNRAQGLRAERKQKVVEEPLSQVYADVSPKSDTRRQSSFAESLGSSRSPQPLAPSARPSSARESASAAPADADSEGWTTGAIDGGRLAGSQEPTVAEQEVEEPGKKGAIDDTGKDTREVTVRVALDPMLGRAGGDGQLLLYRTVVVGEQGYRQGLLLDWRELGRWLEREVLHPNGLGRVAQVSFSGPGSSSADPPAIPNQLERDSGHGGAYVFPHRFGEPFDTLGAILTLEPLPGVGSTTPIYLLAGLLALAAAAGLAAVYRMVSVVVHFAERRNNFVAAVSHELKTPLTSIRMYGEMLRDGLVSSETKRGEYYRTITDESERLSRLINNVLEFSRLEKGQQDLHVARGSLAALLKEVVEQLRPHAEHEGFGLDLDLEPALPALGFDRDAVIQVIFNLVDNSLKYARNAERKQIELVCRRRGDRVFLSLRDYGPGVPRRHLSRVFEAFYRGEDELTRTTKGTGIGLALVKELVESMGASISAANLDPSEGGGFAVQIAFPVERTQSAESTKSGVG